MANVKIVTCLFILLTVIVLTLSQTTREPRSGIYQIHGHEKTGLERYLTAEEKAALEKRIMALLGIPEKPAEQKPRIKRSASQFLLGVYNDVQTNTWGSSNEFKLSKHNIQSIDRSDVIISFMAQQPHQGQGGKPDKVRRMWFDVSAVPVDDDIVMSAELRLYREDDAGSKSNEHFIIKVYRVFRDEAGNRERRFVDSTKTTGSGWVALNVSECLQFWVQNPRENRGLYLEVLPLESSKKVQPESVGIVGFKGDDEKQPFMVGFYKNSGKRNIQLRIKDIITRHPRSTDDNSLEMLPDYFMEEDYSTFAQGEPCGLKDLYVNFRDIKWHDWIIAPSGFDAFYCAGECQHPLAHKVDATNHAIVQSLMHLKHPEKVPKPCCAPSTYSSLSILYFQDENNVVMKKFRNMVVTKCSCM